MVTLDLSNKEQFETIYNSLINQLDDMCITQSELNNIVRTQPNMVTDSNGNQHSIMSRYCFPSENIIYDRQKITSKKLTELQNTRNKYNNSLTQIIALEKLYDDKETKSAREDDIALFNNDKLDLEDEASDLNDTISNYTGDFSVPPANTWKLQLHLLNRQIANINEQINTAQQEIDSYDGIDERIAESTNALKNTMGLENTDDIDTKDKILAKKDAVAIANIELHPEIVKYKANLETYNNEIKELEKKRDADRKVIKDQLNKLKKIKYEDFNVLKKELYNLADITPGLYGETIKEFTQNAVAAQREARRKNIKADLEKKFKEHLNSSGGKHEEEIEIEIGAQLGADLGIDAKARGSIFVKLRVSVQKDDDGKCTVTYGVDPEIKVRGRGNITLSESQTANLRASLSASGCFEHGKTYDNAQDFIDSECENFSAAFLDYTTSKCPLDFSAFKNMDILNKSIAVTETAIAGKKDLTKKLRLMGVINNETELFVPERNRIVHVSSNSLQGSLTGQASGTLKFGEYFGIGASLKGDMSASLTVKSKQINLIDDLSNHPSLELAHAVQNPKNFGIILDKKFITGQDALNAMDEIEANIKDYKSVNSNDNLMNLRIERDRLKKSIEYLAQEYQAFVEVENRIENNGDNGVKLQRNMLRDKRGVTNSADYLKAISVQYAQLKRVYLNTIPDNSELDPVDKEDLKAFEAELKNPKFKISEKQYAEVFNINQKTKTTAVTNHSITGSLEPRGFLKDVDNARATVAGVSFKIQRTSTETPGKPETKNLTLSFKLMSGVKGDHFVAQLLKVSGLNRTAKAKEQKAIENEIKELIKKGITGSIEIKLEKNKNGWKKVYSRAYDVVEKKVTGKSTIPVGPGVHFIVGGGVRTLHQATKLEIPGNDTLVYITDAYRAKKVNSSNKKEWDNYLLQTGVLKEMIKNLNNKESNISMEFDDWIKEMRESNDEAEKNLADRVDNKLKQYRDRTNNNVKAEDFEADFQDMIAKKTQKEDDKEKKNFIARRDIGKSGLKECAAYVIGNRILDLADEHEVPENDRASVDKLLAFAKDKYTADRRDTNFRLLKSAYGIDYASSTLNDLLASDKPERRDNAVNLLDEQAEVLLTDCPKVYINKDLTGELTRQDNGDLEIEPKLKKGQENAYTQDRIDRLVAKSCKSIEVKQLDVVQTNKNGNTERWEDPKKRIEAFKRSATLNFSSFKKSMTAKLKSSKSNSRGFNISEYIEDVMIDTLENRRRQRSGSSSSVRRQ